MTGSRILAGLLALSGAAAVIAGAAGAHGASGQAADWLRTGAEYQMVHALAGLFALDRRWGRTAATLFLTGGLLFAGTLYAMALGAPHILGAVTPIGGLGLIVGWLVLAAAMVGRR